MVSSASDKSLALSARVHVGLGGAAPGRVLRPDTTTAVAELMTREHDSAVVVTARDGLGIVTDADLRGRVMALGVSSDTPVSAIMSRPLHVVDAGASVQEAWLIMLETGRPLAGGRRRRWRDGHALRGQRHGHGRLRSLRASARHHEGALGRRAGRDRDPGTQAVCGPCRRGSWRLPRSRASSVRFAMP